MISMPALFLSSEDLLARLLYRDGLMLVIDKPAGLPVHSGPKGGPNLAAMLGPLRFGLPQSPQLAHRLDRETTGCLALGRHRKALRRLGALFASGRVDKVYWALVENGPDQDEGLIDLPIARRSADRGWWMKPDPAGQPAQTRFRSLARGEGVTWLELRPLTGRTHQLRIHCAESGFPILGDAIYGLAARQGAEPLQLHARTLSIPLYAGKPPIAVVAAPPAAMRYRLAAMGAVVIDDGSHEPG
jgi:tRNA pseudouridine32 synthase / 23S rRNA pseudouridine746 synthase